MSLPTWAHLTEECDKRVRELTAVCIDPASSEMQIRQAQAGIAELRRLLTLPQRLEASAQQQSAASKRREY